MHVTLSTPIPQTSLDRVAERLMAMTNHDISLREAVLRGHTDFLRNITLSFEVTEISRNAIDAFRRHYRVPCVVDNSDMMKDLRMIIPDKIRENEAFAERYRQCVHDARELYKDLYNAGFSERDAGYIMPSAAICTAHITMNLAELVDFFTVECCTKSHWENHELANRMLDVCRDVAPILFERAGPPCMRFTCPSECDACVRQEWESE